MRDVAIILFFVGMSIAAMRRPFYGALIWVLFGLMNPHRLSYGFAYSLPFAQAAVFVTLLSAAAHSRDVRWPRGGPMTILLVMVGWMGLTSAASMVPDPTWEKYVDVLKVLGMTVVVAMLIRTREEIIGLVVTMTLSIGYFGIKGGIFTIMTGGSFRVWGPPSSLVEGNNELAVALIITIPLMYFLATNAAVVRDFKLFAKVPARAIRVFFLVALFLCAAAALGSQSRGALLAISAMGAVLWWRSRAKLSIALVLLVIVVVAIPLLPESWFDRMGTIRSYEEDLSALQRLNAWQTAINIANSRITGAGFTTAHPLVFGIYSPRPGAEWIYVAHSIYFQVLGDHGYIGLLLYLTMWATSYWAAGRGVKLARPHPELTWAANLLDMCRVSMIGFWAGGAFLSLAYWDMPYYLVVLVVATNLLVRQHVNGRTANGLPQTARVGPLAPAVRP